MDDYAHQDDLLKSGPFGTSVHRVWVENTIVRGRRDREQGPHQLGAALWSPQRGQGDRDIYANMRDVQPGDLVLHLTDNEGFTAVSRAAAAVDDSFHGIPGTDWGDRPGYRVALCDFRPLSPPLTRDMFFEDPGTAAQLRAVSAGPRGRGLFFNEKMELNQGAYLTEAPPALVQALDTAYRKHTGKEIFAVLEQSPDRASTLPVAIPIPSPSPRLSGRDILLLRQSRRQKRYADLSNDEQEAYRRIDLILRSLGRLAQQVLGSGAAFPIKFTSGFNPQSGVRGALPKDLWFGVYNTANLPAFVGMPQFFAIISERGVEYGFAPAIHPTDFSQQAIKDKVRAAAPEIFARLPSPTSQYAAHLDAQLRQSGGWQFRQKTRLDAGPGEFSDLSAWLTFLQSERGQHWAGGSISRYVTAEELDQPEFNLDAQIREAAQLFTPLLRSLTPASPLEHQPVMDADLANTVPLVNSEPAPETPAAARLLYPIERALEGLFLPDEEFRRWLEIWRSKRNLVLQGAPGVGKSFVARRLAYALIGYEDPTRVAMIQFHQSYAYEDFVQGFRPQNSGGFQLQDGAFVAFCRRAMADPDESYVFIIDEINRGNLSKILGEMMLLIEPDKRDPTWATRLAYASTEQQAQADPKHRPFYVPKNVFLIGMMNTADRSLAVVDYALRRRFAFVTAQPAFERPGFAAHLIGKGIPDALVAQICARMTAVNQDIATDRINLGPGFCIGHSFFVPRDDAESLDEAWYEGIIETEILPLLSEYGFDNPDKVERWRQLLLAPAR